MKKRTVMVYIVITIFVFSFAVISGFSQEDVTIVEDSAFEEKMRPSVQFVHDEHNEMAEIEECNTCHHVYEDDEKAEDESSEDMECSECHSSDDDANPMSLVKVYHLRCKQANVSFPNVNCELAADPR